MSEYRRYLEWREDNVGRLRQDAQRAEEQHVAVADQLERLRKERGVTPLPIDGPWAYEYHRKLNA